MMRIIIQYVTTYAPYIYAVCGLFALVQIYRLWQVRAERRQAVFTLERERAVNELYNIFSIAMLLLMAMGVTYFFSHTLAAAVAPGGTIAGATPPGLIAATNITDTTNAGFLPTPSDTPLPVTATPTITPLPSLQTPTPSPTQLTKPPTAVPAPAPIVQAPSCSD